MTWDSLKAVREATEIEFTEALAKRHSFVRLSNGKWIRVLGRPDPKMVNATGSRTYEIKNDGIKKQE